MAVEMMEGSNTTAQAALGGAPVTGTWETSRRKQWWLVGTVVALMTLASVDRAVLALLIQPIKTDLKLTDTEISLLLGVSFAVVHAIVTIPSGWAADRWVRRSIIGGAAISWSIMTMACGLATSYWQLFAARAGVGFTEGAIEPSAYSIVRDGVAPERRGRAFGMLGTGPYIGMGGAMILGGVLLGVFSRWPLRLPLIGELAAWQAVLFTVGAIGIPMSLLMLTIREPKRPVSRGSAAAAPEATWTETRRHLLNAWPLYLSVLIFQLSNGLLSSSFGAWMPTALMRVYGMSPLEVGLAYGVGIFTAQPIGAYIAGHAIDLAKKVGHKSGLPLVGLIGTIVIGITAILCPLAHNLVQFWCLFIVLVVFSGVPYPVVATVIARATPSRLSGKVISVRVFISGLVVTSVAPTLVALISDNVFGRGGHGDPRAIAYAISTVSALSTTVCLIAIAVLWRQYVRRVDIDD